MFHDLVSLPTLKDWKEEGGGVHRLLWNLYNMYYILPPYTENMKINQL